jgi:hypothetical protein
VEEPALAAEVSVVAAAALAVAELLAVGSHSVAAKNYFFLVKIISFF